VEIFQESENTDAPVLQSLPSSNKKMKVALIMSQMLNRNQAKNC